MPELSEEIRLLRHSIERVQLTIDTLDEDAITVPSRLPGWARAHVVTHLARAADSRSRLLMAAQRGEIGQQYPSEESRAQEIDEGATRTASTIHQDLVTSFSRLLTLMDGHPADCWDAPGEWLGGARRPVRRAVPSMRREVEYHHVDLDAGYAPEQWPADFVRAQLDEVTSVMTRRSAAPAVTIALPGRTLSIHDGDLVTVTGEPAHVLAWLTGRGTGAQLRTTPSASLPAMPPLA